MGKVRIAGFGMSLDGFSAGVEQSLNDPLGKLGPEIFNWFFPTRFFRSMIGAEGGDENTVDQAYAQRAMNGFGAFILGRNMFGPVRGEWPDETWKGWWGDSPPFHAPTFVLTHYPRDPIQMQGGTTFIFVTGGVREALDRARQAAGDLDVKIGGGVSTARQYLEAGLVDSVNLALAPVLLGKGENLLQGLDLRSLGYQVSKAEPGEAATHITLTR